MNLLLGLLIALMILGMLILIWIIVALSVFLYGMIETKILKRRIPDKIKKEVENERSKKDANRESERRRYLEGERIIEESTAGTSNAESNLKPANNEQLDKRELGSDIYGNKQPERWDQSDNGLPRKFRRI